MGINSPSLYAVFGSKEALFQEAMELYSRMEGRRIGPDTRKVPSLAEAMVAHGALDDSVPQMQAIIDNDGRQRLY